VRLLLTAGALAGLILPAAIPAALAQPARAGARQVSGTPVSVAITSMNPPYATAGAKITVKGIVTNTSKTALTGLTVQLRSSSTPFAIRDQLQQYAAGTDLITGSAVHGADDVLPGSLAPGASASWTAVLPASKVHMSAFGVYPLVAQVTDAAGIIQGTGRTFLPYWPRAHKGHQRPRDDIAWIWPLIDSPHQGPCNGLLDNHLASSLSSGGRLAGLLSAGSGAAGRAARVTWAVDPALLSSARVMAGQYAVGANRNCQNGTSTPASPAAASWVKQLRTTLASQPSFVTPYADVDVAGLTRGNLFDDVHLAFTEGRSVAAQILKRNFTPTAPSAGKASPAALTTATAWPGGGRADYSMLENLAALNGIRTVVLSTASMQPVAPASFTPSAVTATPDGEGGDMRVLLADSTLTQVLGSVRAGKAAPGAAFAVQQRFLAETALIAAQGGQQSPAIVIAPPRHWNPPAGLASSLLTETTTAPWLSPVSAGTLAADRHAPGRVARHAPDDTGAHRFSRKMLRSIKAADRGVQQVQSIRVTPRPQLYQAMAGVESSAWRNTAKARQRARSLLHRITTYTSRQLAGVTLVGGSPVTLGGQKGTIPVAIDNRLDYPVRVRVRVGVVQEASGGFKVLSDPGVILLPPDNITTKKIKVEASGVGTTTITMRLTAPDGRPLPGAPVSATVQATHFGTLALILLAAALGIFMAASAARAIRRGHTPPDPAGSPAPGQQEPPAGTGAGRDAPSTSGASGHEQPEEPDNVGHDRAESGEAGTDHVLTEDADDYARVPGWADRS
jgi:Family of unknown function (DUF6049)